MFTLWFIPIVFFAIGAFVLQSCAGGGDSTAGSPPAESPSAPANSPAPSSSDQGYPHLDWPPPKSSASTNIPSASFRKSQGEVMHLRDIDQKLKDALELNQYTTSYFAVPDGFAIVTQLEHINADGTSRVDDRWRVVDDVETLGKFSLEGYFRALFTANPGYYRVIIFIVTSQPFTQSSESLSSKKAENWLHEGLTSLPEAIANLEFTGEYKITALIYEFRKLESEKNAVISQPSKLNGRLQLERAKLWDNLVN